MIARAILEDGALRLVTTPSWVTRDGATIIPQDDVDALRLLLMEDLTTELDLVHGNAAALGAALATRRVRLEYALRCAIQEIQRHNLEARTTPTSYSTSAERIAPWIKLLEEKTWP